MRKITILIIACCLPLMAAAQATLQSVLESVERNNLTIQAQRHLAEARSLEARTGNSLEELSVSYDHLWGKPVTEFGKTAEFVVSQSFDFPTVYAGRSRLARNLGQQYMNEYAAARQEILLDAKRTWLELQAALSEQRMLEFRAANGKELTLLYERRYEEGDASLLEKSKIRHEYILASEAASENLIKILNLSNRLTSLNGGEPIEAVVVGEPLEELPPYDRLSEDYGELYPAMKALRLQEQGAEFDLRLSRAGALPKFELGYKHEYATAGDRFNGVTVGLSIPIFSNRHNVRRARAAQQSAKLETRAAQVEYSSRLEELYSKAGLLRTTLASYEGIELQSDYLEVLNRALQAGQLNVVDYFSEVYSYFDVVSARLRIELQYRLTVAELTAIYL